MRTFSALFFALALTGAAHEKAHFYGTWEPRPALRDFWRPLDDSWWPTGDSTVRLARYCRDYAKRTTPEALVPEMIADLKKYPTEVHWFVYMAVAVHWPRHRTLHALQPFEKSRDPDLRHIASEFIADLE